MISDDPPKEMNGRGMPVTGSTPMTAPTLITAWLVIQVVMPTARRLPNRSGARVAARRPNQARAKNRPRSTTAPTRPSSSPDHREDEVGVGVGQEAPLLPAAPESQTEDVARAQADERLPHLVARAGLVGPRIEERQDPVPPVGVGQAHDHGQADEGASDLHDRAPWAHRP